MRNTKTKHAFGLVHDHILELEIHVVYFNTFGAGKLQIRLWIGIANRPAKTTPHDCPMVVKPNPKHLYCIGNSFEIRLNVFTCKANDTNSHNINI